MPIITEYALSPHVVMAKIGTIDSVIILTYIYHYLQQFHMLMHRTIELTARQSESIYR